MRLETLVILFGLSVFFEEIVTDSSEAIVNIYIVAIYFFESKIKSLNLSEWKKAGSKIIPRLKSFSNLLIVGIMELYSNKISVSDSGVVFKGNNITLVTWYQNLLSWERI